MSSSQGAAPTTGSTVFDEAELNKLKMADLETLCSDRALSTAGRRKKDLIDRLMAYQAESAAPVKVEVKTEEAAVVADEAVTTTSDAARTPSKAKAVKFDPSLPSSPASPVASGSSSSTSTSSSSSPSSAPLSPVFYVANIIGYLRGILLYVFVHYAFTDIKLAAGAYFASYLLDAADGYAARALGQVSRTGTVLDMVLDRCTSAALAMVVGRVYPEWLEACMAIVILDLASHYVRMYTSMMKNAASHKDVGPNTWFLLRIYYQQRVLMFTLILGCEGLLTFAFLRSGGEVFLVDVPRCGIMGFYELMMYICIPFFAYKQLTNVLQFFDGFGYLIAYDKEEVMKKRK